MTVMTGKVISVHTGAEDVLEKEAQGAIDVALDGIVGDRHRGASRENWEGDKQSVGTMRRNERQWSAVSLEELKEIARGMDLAEPLSARDLGANLCLEGIPNLSQLRRGTLLKFPSGVELMVEEYNPPCTDMGERLASLRRTLSGDPLAVNDFSKAARFLRGVVGVVEVAGRITAGDVVTVESEHLPKWLRD